MLSAQNSKKEEGSSAPTESPVEEAPQSSPQSGFQRSTKTVGFKTGNNDAEAEPIYVSEETARDSFLQEVVGKYNSICEFLRGYDRETREYISFLLINLMEGVTDLNQVHGILNYLVDH